MIGVYFIYYGVFMMFVRDHKRMILHFFFTVLIPNQLDVFFCAIIPVEEHMCPYMA